MNIHLSRVERRRALSHLLIDSGKVDVCVVSESRFIEGRGEELMQEIFREEYEWYGRDRRGQRSKGGEGGVGILMRKGIGEANVIKISDNYDLIWLKIEIKQEILAIGGVYLSPEYSNRVGSLEELLEELEDDISRFRTEGIKLL